MDINGDPILLSEKERGRPGRAGKMAWQADPLMPDEIVLRVLAGKQCAAWKHGRKAFCGKRDIIPNQDRLPPYHCKHHGGMSQGAPKKHVHSLSHGFYCKILRDDEVAEFQEILDSDDIGNLSLEIATTKLRLRKAITAKARQDEQLAEDATGAGLDGDLTLPDNYEESGFSDKGGGYQKEHKARKMIDWDARINATNRELVRLVSTRFAMMGNGDISTQDKARMAREHLKEARERMDNPPKNEGVSHD